MKLYRKEIQPFGLYNTEEFIAERRIPGFEGWYPEEQKEELCRLIFERYSETFKDELLSLIFDERFVEVKTGEWLLEMNDEMMSLVPMYSCSICGNSFSGYYPPDACEHCGAKMIRED